MIIKWNELPNPGTVAFDVETDSETINRRIVLAQFYDARTDTVCLVNDRDVLLKAPWRQYRVKGHNLQFDLLSLMLEGVCDFWDLPEVAYDTFVVAIMAQIHGDRGLKDLVQEYFRYSMKHLGEEVPFFERGKELTPEQISYATDDPYWSWKLAAAFEGKFREHEKVAKLEFGLIPHLVRMTYEGFLVNKPGVMAFDAISDRKIDEADRALLAITGKYVNVDSAKQVQNYLFGDLQLPVYVQTKKGNPSTAADALEYYNHPVVDAIMAVKGAKSLKKSFKSLIPFIDEQSKIHPNFQPIGFEEASSRIYSSKPSVNQAPHEFRDFVHAGPGRKFIYFDLSAAELYLVAKLANCTKLTDVYEAGGDLHDFVSGKILAGLNLDIPEGISKRDISKTVTFATVYGSQGASLARRLKCSEQRAARIVEYFFELFPEIGALQYKIQQEFKKTHTAVTPIGRIRKIAGFDAHAGRQAFNTKIQSGLADYSKWIIIQLNERLWPIDRTAYVAVCVFDSFLMNVDEKTKMDDVRPMVQGIMSGMKLKFNFKMHEGVTWGRAEAA